MALDHLTGVIVDLSDRLLLWLTDAAGITSLIMAPNANLNSAPVGTSNSVTSTPASLGVTTKSVSNTVSTGSPQNQDKSE